MHLWEIKAFGDLNLKEFHDLIALRISVFVIEQNCPYQEVDGKDQHSIHVIGKKDGEIVATARIVAPGLSYSEPSIGRVLTISTARGTGLGHELMEETMKAAKNHFGNVPIRMSAQEHLINFYQVHGFEPVSDVYLEDNIPHIEMLYNPHNNTINS